MNNPAELKILLNRPGVALLATLFQYAAEFNAELKFEGFGAILWQFPDVNVKITMKVYGLKAYERFCVHLRDKLQRHNVVATWTPEQLAQYKEREPKGKWQDDPQNPGWQYWSPS